MFINGKNRSNPVLLWVHGGPGMPDYFLLEQYRTGLEDVFTVVWWDQRGTGLSYGSDIPPATMTVEQFIADTLAVTDYLRWEQIIRVDLTTTVPNLELPVYFFHGAYDYTCSYPLAEEYLRTLTAPLKGFYRFDGSAHSPILEELPWSPLTVTWHARQPGVDRGRGRIAVPSRQHLESPHG
jgi:pimeloyl-ACP methyl ester carboxylesterase